MTFTLGGNLPGGPVLPHGSFLGLSGLILQNYPQYTESYVNLTEKAIWQNSVSYNENHPFFTAKSSKLICQDNTKNVPKESGVRCLLITVSLKKPSQFSNSPSVGGPGTLSRGNWCTVHSNDGGQVSTYGQTRNTPRPTSTSF